MAAGKPLAGPMGDAYVQNNRCEHRLASQGDALTEARRRHDRVRRYQADHG